MGASVHRAGAAPAVGAGVLLHRRRRRSEFSRRTAFTTIKCRRKLEERAMKDILITRFEMPFDILCGGCNSIIAKGVGFDAEKKQVGNYYSTKIWSFSMKSLCCMHKVVIQADPKNAEYVIISGASKKTENQKGKTDLHRPISYIRMQDPSIEVKLKVGDERLANIDQNITNPSETDGWTKEQDMALHKAFSSAQPSPRIWKKVSKMVPGKSAKECYDRIYSDLSTPTPTAPQTRTRKTMLQKRHCIDQVEEADHFSLFEGSPSALQLNISFEDSPGTPDSYMDSDSLGKRTKPTEPSPAVLKPIKNVILHEKYINQLVRRQGTKKLRKRTGSKALVSGKSLSDHQAGSLKAAKNALISEAANFIRSFKARQANSHAHVVENKDEIEFDASDSSHDKNKEL